ncbi:class I SAM-dependent methyltransferase [Paludisphaera rhizosphaerae]|uniref:class I SAM-dependent methyltransferase n=1 Tax=Paludisphaera rhizosphaerae TaxID=2711216 RepID=UPI001F0DF0F9|nr:class I SAM-dependent methyltransferase [Paludisphaera rhizosphaerae]
MTTFSGKTPDQSRSWSRHAARYDEVFLNPYGPGVQNPLWKALDAIEAPETKTVADLGCGTGPLINRLLERFGRVVALDFAPGMLQRARGRVAEADRDRVMFLERTMEDLEDLSGPLDVAVAVNSLVMPDVQRIHRVLTAIHRALRPGGVFLGIAPSMDAIQYHTMLLYDQALERGLAPSEAERFAAIHGEHNCYDFAFGRFRYQGLRQKFWLPFEFQHRFGKAGFRSVTLDKVLYPWDENFAGATELAAEPPSWDWFFHAEA